MLKFFAEKMWVAFAKATHIFSAKNIRILYIESAKTVNEMTLNKLVKLTMFWTTGPIHVNDLEIKVTDFEKKCRIRPDYHTMCLGVSKLLGKLVVKYTYTCKGYTLKRISKILVWWCLGDFKEVDQKFTGCYLKTTKLLDYALIGICVVIRSNTVC